MTRRPFAAAVLLLAATAALESSLASGHAVGSCAIFPANNPWNQRVDSLPVASNSGTIIRSIGASGGLHPDFGSGLYNGASIGIPYTTVKHSQPRVRVSFD